MHDAAIGFVGVPLTQDVYHILIRVACMDNQWQSRFLCRLDMNAQALFLRFSALSGIVII